MKPTSLTGWIELIVRLGLAVVFICAGVLKMQSPQAFADSINDYDLIPRPLINPVALSLPLLEVIVGTMLLLGRQKRGAVFSAILLLGVFTVALVQAAARGLEIDCGCFGTSPEGAWNTWTFVLRDFFLLSIATVIYIKMLSVRNE